MIWDGLTVVGVCMISRSQNIHGNIHVCTYIMMFEKEVCLEKGGHYVNHLEYEN